MVQMTARDIINGYTNGKMSARPEFYAGRGSMTCDLNSQILEMIYDGIKKEKGEKAAEAFVNMVGDMEDDASATTFLVSLYRLEDSGWEYQSKLVTSEADVLAESFADCAKNQGPDATVGAFAGALGAMMGGGFGSTGRGAGMAVIGGFLRNHKAELRKPVPSSSSYWGNDSFGRYNY